MILTQYYEERGRLVAEARDILDNIADDADETTIAEAEQRHDAIMKKVDDLDKKIAREERMLAAENREEERRAGQRPLEDGRAPAGGGGGNEERSEEDVQAEYRDAFFDFLRAGADQSNLTNEQRELLRQGFIENRTQTAGTDAAGGYTVPTTLANFIVEAMLDWGPMYDPGITDEMVTSSGNPFDIPTNDDTGNSAAALAEGADLTDDGSGDLVFGEKSLSAYTYATPWLKVSWELMQDSAFNLEAFIARKLGERLGRLANAQLTIGDGAGDPNGIVTAAAVG